MNIVLFGVGGHARVVAEVVNLEGKYNVVGLVSDRSVSSSFLAPSEVVGTNSELANIIVRFEVQGAIVALGEARARERLGLLAGEHDIMLVKSIHPKAIISSETTIGEGSVVTAGAVVNSGTSIGAGCIINTLSSVDHDCKLGDFVHVCPGAVITGTVTIGNRTWVGAGAVIVDHIDIGRDVFIEAGARVIEDIPDSHRVLRDGLVRRRSSL